jgi:hypothetical protein
LRKSVPEFWLMIVLSTSKKAAGTLLREGWELRRWAARGFLVDEAARREEDFREREDATRKTL